MGLEWRFDEDSGRQTTAVIGKAIGGESGRQRRQSKLETGTRPLLSRRVGQALKRNQKRPHLKTRSYQSAHRWAETHPENLGTKVGIKHPTNEDIKPIDHTKNGLNLG